MLFIFVYYILDVEKIFKIIKGNIIKDLINIDFDMYEMSFIFYVIIIVFLVVFFVGVVVFGILFLIRYCRWYRGYD